MSPIRASPTTWPSRCSTHTVHRVKLIKSAASALNISRKHFYDVLGRFRKRVYAAARLIQENAATELQQLKDRHKR